MPVGKSASLLGLNRLTNTHFSSGENTGICPSPNLTAGEPSVFRMYETYPRYEGYETDVASPHSKNATLSPSEEIEERVEQSNQLRERATVPFAARNSISECQTSFERSTLPSRETS